MKFLIALLVIYTYSLQASTEFVWKERAITTKKYSVQDPMDSVNQEISENLSNYFAPRKPVDVSLLVPKKISPPVAPPRVKKPALPKELVFKQGKYESKKKYETRVNTLTAEYNEAIDEQRKWYISAVKKRNKIIERRNEKYQKAVIQRNKEVEELQDQVDEDYLKIAQEQKDKKVKVEKYLSIFYKNAFKKYYRNPKILSTDYYVNDEIMKVVLGSTANNTKIELEISIPPEKAQSFDTNLKKVKPFIYYDIKNNILKRDISLGLNHVVFKFKGEKYVASISQAERKKNMLENKIEIKPTAEIKQNEKIFIVQNADQAIAKQDVKSESYNFTVVTSKNNDILEALKGKKAANKSSKRWLLAIGIEKYRNTDDISYSRKSTETYIKVVQKLMGVSPSRTMSLLDDKATSATLKHDMKLFLSRIKKGDTLYFYYSGHGIPVPAENNEPYMLASDAYPSDVSANKFFKLKNLYKLLTDSRAGKVVAVVDSCFSGSTDGVGNIKGVAATVLAPKKVTSYNRKKMVILAAGKDNQYSNKYQAKEQRLFTYFVMKALLDNDRKVNKVYFNIEEKVNDIAIQTTRTEQTPVVMGNSKLSF